MLTEKDYKEINKIFESSTVLKKCDVCSEIRSPDLFASLMQMKIVCTKCSSEKEL